MFVQEDPRLTGATGPIVNFFGYTAQGCTNAGSTSQLFNNLKFDPIPTDLDKVYYSSCSRINTPTDTAQSFAFTSDGFNLPNCYLDTFGTDDCTGPSRNQALRSGFSRCINETVGSVNVFCLPAGTFNPRDVEDPVVGDDTEGQVAHWSTRE